MQGYPCPILLGGTVGHLFLQVGHLVGRGMGLRTQLLIQCCQLHALVLSAGGGGAKVR